ncbi:MAG TPA: hypothetical protein VGO92_05995 [Acidimicrobiales bacterium]|nr:hypothetical protein [Acidimicrobiales bacterium]
MRRALIGVAACLLLFSITPGPSRAAGVTNRTAPFDYGVQCFSDDSSAAAPPLGFVVATGCDPAPDPQAQLGRLSVREDTAAANGAVVEQGFYHGAVGHATLGPASSAAGVNVRSAGSGKLTATAVLRGFHQGMRVCLTASWVGYPLPTGSCGAASPTVTVDTTPNTDWAIQVTLYTPARNAMTLAAPCPNSGLATCAGGATWASGADSVTVESISYSFG